LIAQQQWFLPASFLLFEIILEQERGGGFDLDQIRIEFLGATTLRPNCLTLLGACPFNSD
jgi:hypothetical protein